jgi:hypothetical protein
MNKTKAMFKKLIIRLKEWFDYLISKWNILVSLIGGLLGLGYSLLQNQLIPLVCLLHWKKTEVEAEVF